MNLRPARRFFSVGDIVDDECGFEERVGKPLLRDSDNDPVLANQVVSRPSELHKVVAALVMISAHDRSAYNEFFPAGPWTCVSGQSP